MIEVETAKSRLSKNTQQICFFSEASQVVFESLAALAFQFEVDTQSDLCP